MIWWDNLLKGEERKYGEVSIHLTTIYMFDNGQGGYMEMGGREYFTKKHYPNKTIETITEKEIQQIYIKENYQTI